MKHLQKGGDAIDWIHQKKKKHAAVVGTTYGMLHSMPVCYDNRLSYLFIIAYPFFLVNEQGIQNDKNRNKRRKDVA